MKISHWFAYTLAIIGLIMIISGWLQGEPANQRGTMRGLGWGLFCTAAFMISCSKYDK